MDKLSIKINIEKSEIMCYYLVYRLTLCGGAYENI